MPFKELCSLLPKRNSFDPNSWSRLYLGNTLISILLMAAGQSEFLVQSSDSRVTISATTVLASDDKVPVTDTQTSW